MPLRCGQSRSRTAAGRTLSRYSRAVPRSASSPARRARARSPAGSFSRTRASRVKTWSSATRSVPRALGLPSRRLEDTLAGQDDGGVPGLHARERLGAPVAHVEPIRGEAEQEAVGAALRRPRRGARGGSAAAPPAPAAGRAGRPRAGPCTGPPRAEGWPRRAGKISSRARSGITWETSARVELRVRPAPSGSARCPASAGPRAVTRRRSSRRRRPGVRPRCPARGRVHLDAREREQASSASTIDGRLERDRRPSAGSRPGRRRSPCGSGARGRASRRGAEAGEHRAARGSRPRAPASRTSITAPLPSDRAQPVAAHVHDHLASGASAPWAAACRAARSSSGTRSCAAPPGPPRRDDERREARGPERDQGAQRPRRRAGGDSVPARPSRWSSDGTSAAWTTRASKPGDAVEAARRTT